MSSKHPPDEAPQDDFETAVPKHLQDDILQRIEELAWGFSDPCEDIEIIDVERRNALNIEYTGVVRIDGQEHRFHIRSGDMNGTEIISWNGATSPEPSEYPVHQLVPTRQRVDEAVHTGRAAALLDEWAQAMDPSTEAGARLSHLPSAAAYDAFFAPGTGAARSHHDKARAAGYEILEEADALRARHELLEGAFDLVPVASARSCALDLLVWKEARKTGHPATEARREILLDVARRGGTFPIAEESLRLEPLGFSLDTRLNALKLWTSMVRPLLILQPIDGFDPASLPEDPIAALFNRLDPALAPDTRTNPRIAGERLLDQLALRMAREVTMNVPDGYQDSAAKIGFRILNRARPESDPDGMLPQP